MYLKVTHAVGTALGGGAQADGQIVVDRDRTDDGSVSRDRQGKMPHYAKFVGGSVAERWRPRSGQVISPDVRSLLSRKRATSRTSGQQLGVRRLDHFVDQRQSLVI